MPSSFYIDFDEYKMQVNLDIYVVVSLWWKAIDTEKAGIQMPFKVAQSLATHVFFQFPNILSGMPPQNGIDFPLQTCRQDLLTSMGLTPPIEIFGSW